MEYKKKQGLAILISGTALVVLALSSGTIRAQNSGLPHVEQIDPIVSTPQGVKSYTIKNNEISISAELVDAQKSKFSPFEEIKARVRLLNHGKSQVSFEDSMPDNFLVTGSSETGILPRTRYGALRGVGAGGMSMACLCH